MKVVLQPPTNGRVYVSCISAITLSLWLNQHLGTNLMVMSYRCTGAPESRILSKENILADLIGLHLAWQSTISKTDPSLVPASRKLLSSARLPRKHCAKHLRLLVGTAWHSICLAIPNRVKCVKWVNMVRIGLPYVTSWRHDEGISNQVGAASLTQWVYYPNLSNQMSRTWKSVHDR